MYQLARAIGISQECFQLEQDAGLDMMDVSLQQAQAVAEWYCNQLQVPLCYIQLGRECKWNRGSYSTRVITLRPRGMQLATLIHEIAHHVSHHATPLSHCHDAAFRHWHKRVLLMYGLEVFELAGGTGV